MIEHIVSTAIILGLIYWLYDVIKNSNQEGEITVPSGHSYKYELGNRLPRPGVTFAFKGIRAYLPATLPHMYIDAHKGDRGRGASVYIDKQEMIALEGTFNDYFQVYIPKGTEVLALSILTPDIMQALITVSSQYDVEFAYKEVRLLSHSRPYKHPEREAALRNALTVLLTEIDHKLKSWSKADSVAASAHTLQYQDVPTIKIGKQRARLTTLVLGSIFGLLGIVIWWVVLETLSHGIHSTTSIIEGFITAFLVFPVIFLLIIIGTPRGWFNHFFD
jgi:hypothetical protein